MFVFKKQYIAQLEILAAIAVYFSLPTSMTQHREIIHFIDNTGAISSLLHGTSRKPDNTLLVNVFHMFNAGLQARPFWQYVASAANIADMPSRNDFELLSTLNSSFMPTIIPPTDVWFKPLKFWLSAFHSTKRLRTRNAASSARKKAFARHASR